MRFRKRPVVIDAVQWDGTNAAEIWEFMHGVGARTNGSLPNWTFIIPTPEGDMTAAIGDWIIKGTQGEFYPCKPDVFKDIYEPVSTDIQPTQK